VHDLVEIEFFCESVNADAEQCNLGGNVDFLCGVEAAVFIRCELFGVEAMP